VFRDGVRYADIRLRPEGQTWVSLVPANGRITGS
jgi:hypothetical protein